MTDLDKSNVKINDEKERQQLSQAQKEPAEDVTKSNMSVDERKALVKKKSLYEKSKKWHWYSFTNIITAVAIIGLIIAGIFTYREFFHLSGPVYGGENYNRLAENPELSKQGLSNVNDKFKDTDGSFSAKVEQYGPVVAMYVVVPDATAHDSAKKYANEVIDTLIKELGDSKSPEAPYGKTFQNYDLQITVVTKTLPSLTSEQKFEQANEQGKTNPLPYPFYGNIKKGVLSWSNN